MEKALRHHAAAWAFAGLLVPAFAAAQEEPQQEPRLEIHLRAQGWYQWVEDGSADGDLNDFQMRRVYLSLAGQLTPRLGLFAHLATDRLGQDGLDDSSLGLGSGLAIRDAWIVFELNEAVKVQAGRMYVPFTRAFGTESTFTLLALDIPWTQGGVRGSPFYPGKVGRDDGVVLWGNLAGDRLQYRLGVAEGVEGARNPSDELRASGRLALYLLEPETAWFNSGSYLGEKRVLAIGAGFDTQDDLSLDGRMGQDYSAWTVDVFLDHPIGQGAGTVEAAWVESRNTPNAVAFTNLAPGDDHNTAYLQAGYLLPQWPDAPGRWQVYGRYERMDVEDRPDTSFTSAGVSWLLDGHARKLTLDWTRIDQDGPGLVGPGAEERNLVTLQVAAGL
ncbi:MAG: porin [Thermoanaerobaculia bacterium]